MAMKYADKKGVISDVPQTNGQMSRRLLLASGLAAGVSACSKPAPLIGVPSTRTLSNAELKSRGHRIYIATTRRASEVEGEFYSGERGSSLSFAAVDVIIPPNHVAGQVERPRNPPVNPDKHFMIINPETFPTRLDLRRAMDAEMLKRPRGKREAMLWIHGYNTTLTSAVLRLAQFVEDTGYTGVPFLYSWASQGKLTGYVYDINSALIARDYLEDLPNLLRDSPIEGIDIIAHSMGNLAAMEAIRGVSKREGFNSTGKLRHVILADPDIDIDLFVGQLRRIPQDQRNFFVLTSGDDKALALSARIARKPRVGQLDAAALTSLGVNVIDLTQVSDTNSINHTKFVDSPDVVQLLGSRILAGDSFDDHTRFGAGEKFILGAGGAVIAVDDVNG